MSFIEARGGDNGGVKSRRPFLGVVVGSVLGFAAVAMSPAAVGMTVPDAPTGVTLSGADSGISVTWTAPANDGGATINRYTASAYTSASGGSAESTCTMDPPGTLTCVISGLTAGSTYYVGVTARNSQGTGAESTRVSGVAGTLPSAPRSVSAVRIVGGGKVRWSAPSSTGGMSITGYTATAYTSTTSSEAVGTCTTDALECTISGLEADTTYYVSVRATNAVGTGSASSRVTLSKGGVPGAPTNVKAPQGNGFSRVTWSAPTSNGNSTITRYEVRAWSAATGGDEVADCQPASTSSLSCDLGPLPNGTTYYVDVTALNAFGAGAASSPRVATTPATSPSVPQNVAVARLGSNAVVTWSVPIADGGLPISSYVATAYPSETGTSSVGSCASSGTTCSISGLVGGTIYVSVIARTQAGDSAASAPRQKVRLISPAEGPIAVMGSARPEGMFVTWRPPINDGGRGIQSYKAVAYDSPSGGQVVSSCVLEVKKANADEAGAGAERRVGCTIAALKPKTIYYVEVGAVTEYGVTNSLRSAMGVRQGKPLPPRAMQGAPRTGELAIAWMIPAADGGERITEYRVQAWSEEKGGDLLTSCTVKPDSQASFFGCSLDVASDYEPHWVQVQARNERGWGNASARVNLEARPSAPSAPQEVSVKATSAGLVVDWDPPLANGGYPITSYVASAYDAATGGRLLGSCTVKRDVESGKASSIVMATQCTITGLPPEAYAYVEVSAENTVGVGSPSTRVGSSATPVA